MPGLVLLWHLWLPADPLQLPAVVGFVLVLVVEVVVHFHRRKIQMKNCFPLQIHNEITDVFFAAYTDNKNNSEKITKPLRVFQLLLGGDT